MVVESTIIADLRIPSETRYAHIARSTILARARFLGISEEDLEYFLTALGEALANALEHAGTKNPIRVRCRLDERKISAIISDTGCGFIENSRSAALPHPLSESGRGLPLMRRCSHILHIRSIPGRGTTVFVGRYINTTNV
jgi:anti-sigma regulatory factor (Ser/Thr protein kinase)